MPARRRHLVALALVAIGTAGLMGQSLSLDRQRGEMMLDTMLKDLREHYYDPAFHGIDVNSRMAAAKQRIRSAASTAEILGIVAQAAVDLDDSHTRFLPPMRTFEHQLGVDVSVYWGMEMTVADLVHADGKSLKHVGVAPDVMVLPTQEDLAQDRDPVLAQVAATLGVSIDATKAAALFARHN